MNLYHNHFEKTVKDFNFVPDTKIAVSVRQASVSNTGTDVHYQVPVQTISSGKYRNGDEFSYVAVRAVTNSGEECFATVFVETNCTVSPDVTVYTTRFPESALIVYNDDVLTFLKH